MDRVLQRAMLLFSAFVAFYVISGVAFADSGLSPLFYLQAQRNGGMAQPWLPMGSEEAISKFYGPTVNYVPNYTLDPWLYYGMGDGRYFSGYPFEYRDPSWPQGGYSPSYYHSRRYNDSEATVMTSYSSSYSYSRHAVAYSAPSSGRQSGTGQGTSGQSASRGNGAADASQPARASGTGGGQSVGAQQASAPPGRVIEPTWDGDIRVIYPDDDTTLPSALVGDPTRTADALSPPAAVSPRTTDLRMADPTATGRPQAGGTLSPPLRIRPPEGASVAGAVSGNFSVGGVRPPPPLGPDGQLPLPRPPAASGGGTGSAATVTTARPPGETSSAAHSPPTGAGAGNAQEAVIGAEACVGICDDPALLKKPESIPDLLSELERVPPQAKGARKIFATLYQNCAALRHFVPLNGALRGTVDPAENVQSHVQNPNRYFNLPQVLASYPYLKDTYDGKVCRDMRKTVPVFHPGGKAEINYRDGKLEINVFNNRSNLSGGNLVTMDCSGFISASFAAAGMKMRKSGNASSAYQLGTGEMLDLGVGKNKDRECMDRVQFTSDSSLKAGDVMVLKDKASNYGHSLMFDSVGPDPFALSKITSAQQCNDRYLNPGNFQFTVIQSSRYAGRMAATRMAAREFTVNAAGTAKFAFEMAIRACQAKFKGPRSAYYTEKIDRDGTSSTMRVALIRHKGESDPECIEDGSRRIRVRGEECLGDCPEVSK